MCNACKEKGMPLVNCFKMYTYNNKGKCFANNYSPILISFPALMQIGYTLHLGGGTVAEISSKGMCVPLPQDYIVSVLILESWDWAVN